jgi:hypothetical protein
MPRTLRYKEPDDVKLREKALAAAAVVAGGGGLPRLTRLAVFADATHFAYQFLLRAGEWVQVKGDPPGQISGEALDLTSLASHDPASVKIKGEVEK